MDSDRNVSDFEYVEIGPDGRFGVKNGQKYPISDEEWRKANPEHKDVGCKECSFVQDKQTLLLYVVPREFREDTGEKPYGIGKFHMPGWTGHANFYLFACKGCGRVTVDYPHGYANDGLINGLLYLYCDDCGTRVLIYDKKMYNNEGMESPPSFLEMLFGAVKRRWRMRREPYGFKS